MNNSNLTSLFEMNLFETGDPIQETESLSNSSVRPLFGAHCFIKESQMQARPDTSTK